MVQTLGLRAHPGRGPVADGEQPTSEIIHLQLLSTVEFLQPVPTAAGAVDEPTAQAAAPAYAASMPPEDLEPRVRALEGQVQDLRRRVAASERDAAAARVLAGGADRDVGELGEELRDFRNATTASFNAMRRDMVDGFAEMRGKFDVTAAGQQHIVELIQTVIDTQGGAAPA